MVASLYVFSPQARPHAISQLTLHEAEQIIETGSVGSSNFKTENSFGVQLITATANCRRVLLDYKDVLRPLIKFLPERFDEYGMHHNNNYLPISLIYMTNR
jgi:hypothetical protein